MIWLSGSRGFVGTYLNHALRNSGYSVKCLSNSTSEDQSVVTIDFSSRKQIRGALEKYGVPHTFIHLGWKNVYQINDDCHITSNVNDSINLIDELYAAGTKKFISIGSVSEYAGRIGILKEDEFVAETANNYARGKVIVADYGLKTAEELNRIFIHIRLVYTYGAGQRHNSLINQLFACSYTDEIMNLSPCEHYRDYIHILDAVEGMKKIICVNQSGIVNLGSGQVIQLKEFVELFWKELGAAPNQLKFGAHDQPTHEQSQPKSFVDVSKLKKLTKWSPTTSIEEGIQLTVQKMKLNDKL
jgi:nucleoside-diphosphate-sugar epimerase